MSGDRHPAGRVEVEARLRAAVAAHPGRGPGWAALLDLLFAANLRRLQAEDRAYRRQLGTNGRTGARAYARHRRRRGRDG